MLISHTMYRTLYNTYYLVLYSSEHNTKIRNSTTVQNNEEMTILVDIIAIEIDSTDFSTGTSYARILYSTLHDCTIVQFVHLMYSICAINAHMYLVCIMCMYR